MISRTARVLVVGACVLGLAAITPARPAAAQEVCDPAYGCEPPPPQGPPAPVPPECTASPTEGEVGARIDVTVTNVPGGSSVDLRFDGTVVATGSAPPGEASDVAMSFTVPETNPGRHSLIAVGAGFQADCAFATGGVAVLAGGAEAPGGGAGIGGVGGGSLARTGIAIALLVAIGLALVVGGRAALESSRRSRRRAALARSVPTEEHDPATSSR